MTFSDKAKGALIALIKQVVAKYDYACLWPCTVVSQNADTSLELRPDDAALPGLSSVPIWSLPGTTVKVAPGARLRVGFDGADPSKPFAALFEPSNLVELQFGGAQPIARLGDTVATAIPPGFTFTAAINGLISPNGAVTAPLGFATCKVVAAPKALVGTVVSGSQKAKA